MSAESEMGFRAACRLAGIDELIWKHLRATFGTELAEVGRDAFTIAQLLGHSDIRVTMRYRTIFAETRAWFPRSFGLSLSREAADTQQR